MILIKDPMPIFNKPLVTDGTTGDGNPAWLSSLLLMVLLVIEILRDSPSLSVSLSLYVYIYVLLP